MSRRPNSPVGAAREVFDFPIGGMDCADCAGHVRDAVASVPGVESVEVLLSTERARVVVNSELFDRAAITQAVQAAGYDVVTDTSSPAGSGGAPARALTGAATQHWAMRRLILTGFLVLAIAVIGEVFGLLDSIGDRVPWPVGLVVVLASGWPIFRNVLRATRRRRVTAHTLMTVGVVTSLVVGAWPAALIIVAFMRIGDGIERSVAKSGRRAIQDLLSLAPSSARIQRNGVETEVPINDVRPGDIVLVRAGERIPVDGTVVSGHAAVNRSSLTGESDPVPVGPDDAVETATIAIGGSLHILTGRVGAETTFARVVRLVEEAETHRGDSQRLADRFATWFLPVVITIAALTFMIRRDPMAVAAVTVVACSCSLALATPIAVLAAVGAGAKRGVLLKGGRAIEALARVDVLLVDKTGTLTLGQPAITDIVPIGGNITREVLSLAAAAEREGAHPLAAAVRRAAHDHKVDSLDATQFTEAPGLGVRATVNGEVVSVGSPRWMPDSADLPEVRHLESVGRTVLIVSRSGTPVGVLGATDQLRADAPAALAKVRELGIERIEILTGDHERAAATMAAQLSVPVRARLLPDEKHQAVLDHRRAGRVVAMVGDGINDAPALAAADVGIAMGAAGSDLALEVAHVALLGDDWSRLPEAMRLARRTTGVIRLNLGFTVIYNTIGLTLAALGFLPPTLAAAAQAVPDLAILGNSSRLLRSEVEPAAFPAHPHIHETPDAAHADPFPAHLR